MKALEIKNLSKYYPAFTLNKVSFSVEEGEIIGFIGRNGAGKTTTLKSLLGLVHPDEGEIRFFGKDFSASEQEIKGQIGFATGGVNYYSRSKLKDILKVTSSFYPTWDDETMRKYMKKFALDENKCPKELSEGMKVKFNLVIALSHHAKLLILDEPTSGLDPISREELLEVFLDLAQKERVAILFSTHITSDLEKCAQRIVYIQKGVLLADAQMEEFVNSYRNYTVNGRESDGQTAVFKGISKGRTGDTALILTEDAALFEASALRLPTLEEIMVHLEKEEPLC